MLYVLLAGVVVFVVAVVLWLGLGPGPCRWRAFRRAQRLLEGGGWEEALALVSQLRRPRLSEAWQGRLRNLEGECHQRAVDQALKDRRFEEALEHALKSADLLALDADEQRSRVVEAALAEVRRLFAAGDGPDETEAVLAMLERVAALRTPSTPPEATFWQALCAVRRGEFEPALALLTLAYEAAGRQVIDPALYLGLVLHRLGRPQDALRYLADANRLDGACAFVTWQMGVSLVGSGGDSGLAMRALQRALGPRGLSLWLGSPQRAWVEAFPEGKSWVRRLAAKYRYVCPLLGGDLAVVIRQGQFALAQAFYRLERFQEAADLYGKLMQESPPTPLLLRNYGLALARLKLYDQAYKHLRTALEQEEPKDPFTAGYLALCGALGRPTQIEDKPKNVTWALRLLARFPVRGNAEWAGLISDVHAEARHLEMPIASEDQLLLCASLASVNATDPQAAAGYAHLALTYPDGVLPLYAWLYVRASSLHGVTGPAELDLFARTFRDATAASEFFTRQGWSFDEAEYTYLRRTAVRAPGRFPEALGPDYPARGTTLLLELSRQHEAAGKAAAARECVEVLLRLAPDSLAGHDRLACLHYRQGDLDRSVTLLNHWQRLAPHDHWPLVRQAIIEQERGHAAERAAAIDRALGLTHGAARASVAFLGAKLSLRQWGKGAKEASKEDLPDPDPELSRSLHLLQTCLRDDPNHTQALWCLAAVRSVLGDREGLAGQAALMNRADLDECDARFHYLGAVCHLAARDYRRALELAQRAGKESSLALESQFVAAWAHLGLGDGGAAQKHLEKVAAAEASPSSGVARALLGQLSYQAGKYDEAIRWWSAVEPAARSRWQLDEPLRQTTLLAGLAAFDQQRFEAAADRFREAGKLGLRDKRLGGLITLALVKAGQRLLYSEARRGSEEKEKPAASTTTVRSLARRASSGEP
jgi:tetratricopeptide (TPR) repeat protein